MCISFSCMKYLPAWCVITILDARFDVQMVITEVYCVQGWDIV